MSNENDVFWSNIEDNRLPAAGVTPAQVQAVWVKTAESSPDPFPQHVEQLTDNLETIIRIIKAKFPNTKVAYISNRIYGGLCGHQSQSRAVCL